MSELQRELIKYNLLNPQQPNQPQHRQTQFTEILGLLIFSFMVMAYYNNLHSQIEIAKPRYIQYLQQNPQPFKYVQPRANLYDNLINFYSQ